MSNLPHIDIIPKTFIGTFDTRTPNCPIFVRVIGIVSDDEEEDPLRIRVIQNQRENEPQQPQPAQPQPHMQQAADSLPAQVSPKP